MPKLARNNRAAPADEDVVDRRMPRVFVLQSLGWSHRDAVGCIVAIAATVLILVNVLFLQSGPHPAPMLKTGLIQTASVATTESTAAAPALPRARPPELATAKPEPSAATAGTASQPRPADAILSDIQRELARRGFYDGPLDGRNGRKTEAAIRDFEHAAGLKPSTEPGEALLQAIRASNTRSKRPAGRAGLPAHNDPIAALLASNHAGASERVRGVQRALADYGYGQIDPTGVLDAQTKAAIAKFERARSLPVTGLVSDRLTRELATITGRPLE